MIHHSVGLRAAGKPSCSHRLANSCWKSQIPLICISRTAAVDSEDVVDSGTVTQNSTATIDEVSL